MKYTPGPWRIAARSGEGSYVMAGKSVVAHVFDAGTIEEENRHLIAAAPELLEACKWALQQIPKYSARIKGQNESYCDGWDKLQAAIAKAETV